MWAPIRPPSNPLRLSVRVWPRSEYCSDRVRRLRTGKGVKMTQGRGRKYERKDVTPDKVTDLRHVLIPLFQAEGAWAFAMHLKQVRTLTVRVRMCCARELAGDRVGPF